MNPIAKPSRRRQLAFYGLVALICVLPPLLIAEAWLRVRERNVDLWEVTGRKLGRHPMAEWAAVDAFAAYRAKPGKYLEKSPTPKTVNSFGHISTPEIRPEKPPGVLRIVYLGGSSTAGTGHLLGDRDTWPWLASEAVAEATGRRIEFINAALGGYSSFESYGRFWSRIRFFHPDIAVVYHGWNEMYYFNNMPRLPRWRTLSDGSWTFDRTERLRGTHEPYLLDHLVRFSQVLIRLRLRFGGFAAGEQRAARPASAFRLASTKTEALADSYDPRAPEVFRTNLRLLRETAGILGIDLFVAKQATLIVPDLPPAERQRCRYDLHGFGHDAHVRAFDDLYRVIDDEIAPGRIVDVTPISGRPELFYDHIHPTLEGARAIAEIVSRDLVRHLGTNPPAAETQPEEPARPGDV